MKSIELHHHIDSETLTLPELRPFIGRNVRITVVDESDDQQKASDEFWNPPSLEELALRQGVKPTTSVYHDSELTAADFEGFDEWLDEIRGHNKNKKKDAT